MWFSTTLDRGGRKFLDASRTCDVLYCAKNQPQSAVYLSAVANADSHLLRVRRSVQLGAACLSNMGSLAKHPECNNHKDLAFWFCLLNNKQKT